MLNEILRRLSNRHCPRSSYSRGGVKDLAVRKNRKRAGAECHSIRYAGASIVQPLDPALVRKQSRQRDHTQRQDGKRERPTQQRSNKGVLENVAKSQPKQRGREQFCVAATDIAQ